jgi:protein-S-isoprenylcysteine O-methyltransferase Ste14
VPAWVFVPDGAHGETGDEMWLLVKAIIAFLFVPGVVAFLVPLALLRSQLPERTFGVLGIVPLTLGTILLVWCVAAFYRHGRGTLAPWDPPRHLVVSGLYSWSRNPMYVAVVLILWGWALGFRSPSLAIYALAIMAAFQVRIVWGEEPWLARTHGEQWVRYRERVPRWFRIPRRSRRPETTAPFQH